MKSIVTKLSVALLLVFGLFLVGCSKPVPKEETKEEVVTEMNIKHHDPDEKEASSPASEGPGSGQDKK